MAKNSMVDFEKYNGFAIDGIFVESYLINRPPPPLTVDEKKETDRKPEGSRCDLTINISSVMVFST